MRVGRRSIDHKVDSTWPFRSKVASLSWDIGSKHHDRYGTAEAVLPDCLMFLTELPDHCGSWEIDLRIIWVLGPLWILGERST
jgi:hypothetical protein